MPAAPAKARSHFASGPNLAPGPLATARPKPVVRAAIAPCQALAALMGAEQPSE
ncbi:MAG: hypothetical protein F6J97_16850 [Leptolyngbya sp. SIO4C1]|nr:hypothetical protein [Leptolyngbya sp. SIO4C1]